MIMLSTISGPFLTRSCLAAALATCAALCAPPRGRGQPHLVLKMASLAPESSPQNSQLRRLGAKISGATSETLEYKLFPAGRLGKAEAIIDKLETGEIQIAALSADALARSVPALALLSSPGAFPTPRACQQFFSRTGRGPLNQALAQKGLAFFTAGPSVYRSWFIRTNAQPSAPPSWATINAAPVVPRSSLAEQIEWPLRQATLATKPVDRQHAFLLRSTAVEARLQGVDAFATHIFRANDVLETQLVVFSQRWFDGLPEHLQEIVRRIGRQASVAADNEAARTTNDTLIDRMAARGVVVIEAPRPTSQERRLTRRVQNSLAKRAGHAGAALLSAIRRSGR